MNRVSTLKQRLIEKGYKELYLNFAEARERPFWIMIYYWQQYIEESQ